MTDPVIQSRRLDTSRDCRWTHRPKPSNPPRGRRIDVTADGLERTARRDLALMNSLLRASPVAARPDNQSLTFTGGSESKGHPTTRCAPWVRSRSAPSCSVSPACRSHPSEPGFRPSGSAIHPRRMGRALSDARTDDDHSTYDERSSATS